MCGRALAPRARETTVDEEVPRRGWLLRREPAALHEIAEAIFIQRAHPPDSIPRTLCTDRKSEKGDRWTTLPSAENLPCCRQGEFSRLPLNFRVVVITDHSALAINTKVGS
jgi:hypothetical protein